MVRRSYHIVAKKSGIVWTPAALTKAGAKKRMKSDLKRIYTGIFRKL